MHNSTRKQLQANVKIPLKLPVKMFDPPPPNIWSINTPQYTYFVHSKPCEKIFEISQNEAASLSIYFPANSFTAVLVINTLYQWTALSIKLFWEGNHLLGKSSALTFWFASFVNTVSHTHTFTSLGWAYNSTQWNCCGSYIGFTPYYRTFLCLYPQYFPLQMSPTPRCKFITVTMNWVKLVLLLSSSMSSP